MFIMKSSINRMSGFVSVSLVFGFASGSRSDSYLVVSVYIAW